MVFLNSVLLCKHARKKLSNKYGNFIDSLRIYVRGGAGGNGYPIAGGIGGKGGDVILTPDAKATLMGLRTQSKPLSFIGKSGMHASKFNILGEPGTNVEVGVPLGITVKTNLGKEMGSILSEESEDVIVARGGMGGEPSNSWIGQPGEAMNIFLDLKLLADIGLVGFPNAGKSTLLRAISRAKPKIANYPFTTLRPHIGVVRFEDLREFTLADLPGLIEGAHRNIGLGHKFLKHVERTKMLMFVVDIHGFQLQEYSLFRNVIETILLLNKELELYDETLVDKPAVLVVNKMDIDDAKTKLNDLEVILRDISKNCTNYIDSELAPNKVIEFSEVIPISAKHSQTTVSYLKNRLRFWLDYFDDLERGTEGEENVNQIFGDSKIKRTPDLM